MRIMRIKCFLFFLPFFLSINTYSKTRFPQPQGFVNDFAGVLSSSDRVKLESLFRDLESKTEAEIAVVTVKSTAPLDIETYAVELFQDWGIGKKGKDNGVLFLIALEDRKMRIEVGYGLEGAIPDALAKQIIVNIVAPSFKQENYAKGIIEGSIAIANLVAKEYNITLSGLEKLPSVIVSQKRPSQAGVSRLLLSLLFFIIIFGFRWGFLWWAILTPGNYHRRGGFWYGSGYGGYSGGFSGGFGGFGGGLSGGGGASGSW